jgi:hypothetical protein
LFVLDEMQNVDGSALGAMCMAFHRITQKNLPVALVGTGLPQLPRLLREAKPYAERLFTTGTLTVFRTPRRAVR